MSDSVSVSREIAAPAEQVWAMVSDIRRMGEWSPENVGGEWIGGATGPAVGAKFRGRNRLGKRSWKTVAIVTACEPGRVFTFRVKAAGMKISDWSYAFEATDSGCRVTESWTDLRPGFLKPIVARVLGVKDRAAHNRAGMEQTLERLAAAAEA